MSPSPFTGHCTSSDLEGDREIGSIFSCPLSTVYNTDLLGQEVKRMQDDPLFHTEQAHYTILHIISLAHRVISASTGCITWICSVRNAHRVTCQWVLVLVNSIYWGHCCWLVHVMPKPMTLVIMSNREANDYFRLSDYSSVGGGMEKKKQRFTFIPWQIRRLWLTLHWFEFSPFLLFLRVSQHISNSKFRSFQVGIS